MRKQKVHACNVAPKVFVTFQLTCLLQKEKKKEKEKCAFYDNCYIIFCPAPALHFECACSICFVKK